MARITLPSALSAAMALVVLCGASFAADATTATAAQCTALEKQYDSASKEKVTPEKLKKSQAHRSHGADLCAQGKPDEGVKALKAALKDIGIKAAN
jgi:hypothetical protein